LPARRRWLREVRRSSVQASITTLAAFKRSSKHNHISRYTSTGRRLPARPPLGFKVQASITTLAVTPAQEGGCPPARRRGSKVQASITTLAVTLKFKFKLSVQCSLNCSGATASGTGSDSRSIPPQGAQASSGDADCQWHHVHAMLCHFSYPFKFLLPRLLPHHCTRARRFLPVRYIPSQVCFKPEFEPLLVVTWN
jgi:hypothetical protein